MFNRIKKLFESIVYAGMTPGARSAASAPAAKSGWIARWLNGPSQSDPLYLTNQSFGQKARRVLFMGAPMMVVVLAGFLAVYMLRPKAAKVPRQLTTEELKATVLPEFNKEIKLESNHDLEVTEVHCEHDGGHHIVGNLKNNTDHEIIQAVVVFELADPNNSGVGGVTVTEMNLPPRASRNFKMPIEQANAITALVREVETK